MYFGPQDIANEGGSGHKTNKQHQYVEFNVSDSNEEASPDQFNFRSVRTFIEVLDLLDQSLDILQFWGNDKCQQKQPKVKQQSSEPQIKNWEACLKFKTLKIYKIVSQKLVAQ